MRAVQLREPITGRKLPPEKELASSKCPMLQLLHFRASRLVAGLIPGFVTLLQALPMTMTTPTFDGSVTVVTG
jgi:hypothetical protein